nr:hypothetical protein [Tanacetum cinerariifolium]
MHTERGDGIAITKQRRQDFHSDGVTDLTTASERSRLKVDLDIQHGDGVRDSTRHRRNVVMGAWSFCTWMAFGGNTCDLGSFGEETDEITDLHQILEEVLLTAHGDGVAGITRRRRDPSGDGVRDFVTA